MIAPIPGTRNLERLDENLGAAAVELTSNDLREMENACTQITVHGAPHSESHLRLIAVSPR